MYQKGYFFYLTLDYPNYKYKKYFEDRQRGESILTRVNDVLVDLLLS